MLIRCWRKYLVITKCQYHIPVAIDPLYSLEQIELQILEVEELIAKEEQQISGGIEVNQ